jgi:hypothetical protein
MIRIPNGGERRADHRLNRIPPLGLTLSVGWYVNPPNTLMFLFLAARPPNTKVPNF